MDNKFNIGDTAWILRLDNQNLGDAAIIKCKVKLYSQGYVELEHEVDGKWVDYYDGTMSVFYDKWVFHTKSECKNKMIEVWDRTELYEREKQKIINKIEKLNNEMSLILENDLEHKEIVKTIKKL